MISSSLSFSVSGPSSAKEEVQANLHTESKGKVQWEANLERTQQDETRFKDEK